MNNYTVYAHINKLNGKVYIGITSMKPQKRWGHNGRPYWCSSIFYNAIQKYGWDNFHHVILEDNLTKSEACGVEIELIAYYKSQGISYNNADGGEINEGFHHSAETKKRLSIANMGEHNPRWGKQLSEEAKKRISDLNRGNNNGMYGKRGS